jgi:hypothetical protein
MLLSLPKTIAYSSIFFGFIFITGNSIKEINKILMTDEKFTHRNVALIINISILTFSSALLLKSTRLLLSSV